MLKLDIARVFDSVSWGFLMEVLRKIGFGPRFCEFVSILLSTASARVMLNGEPGPPSGIGGASDRGSLVAVTVRPGDGLCWPRPWSWVY